MLVLSPSRLQTLMSKSVQKKVIENAVSLSHIEILYIIDDYAYVELHAEIF